MAEPDDAELMTRVKRGDADAYAALFERHAERLWRVAFLVLHSSADADDAIQEAFTLGFEHSGSFREGGDPAGWLYMIVLNTCRQKLRRCKVREERAAPRVLEGGQPLAGRPHGILTSIVRRETNRRLAVALGFLNESQRETFILHYVEGLPFKSVAVILDTTEGAARVQAFRARQILQEKLGDLGLE